jgi:hypothetical protein
MAHPSKRKGDVAELELAKLLADSLGIPVKRMLGAGRQEDCGDLHGLTDWTAEVKNYANVADGINEGLRDLDREQANAGTPFGVVFVRRRGGRWLAVMDVDRWCSVYRETTAQRHGGGWDESDDEPATHSEHCVYTVMGHPGMTCDEAIRAGRELVSKRNWGRRATYRIDPDGAS